jgi:hypothetical protein
LAGYCQRFKRQMTPRSRDICRGASGLPRAREAEYRELWLFGSRALQRRFAAAKSMVGRLVFAGGEIALRFHPGKGRTIQVATVERTTTRAGVVTIRTKIIAPGRFRAGLQLGVRATYGGRTLQFGSRRVAREPRKAGISVRVERAPFKIVAAGGWGGFSKSAGRPLRKLGRLLAVEIWEDQS